MNLVAIILLSFAGGILRSALDPLGIFGTLCVNLLGSLALGLIAGLLTKKNMPTWVQSGVGAGLIGSFTTFSAFASDTETLMVTGVWIGVAYVVCSIAGGVACSMLGERIGGVLLQVKSNDDEKDTGEERGALAILARYQTKVKTSRD